MQLVSAAAFGFLGAPKIVEEVKEDETEKTEEEDPKAKS